MSRWYTIYSNISTYLCLYPYIPMSLPHRCLSISIPISNFLTLICLPLCYLGSFPFFLSFCLFRATPMAYRGSQARGLTGALATGLCHSHSNIRSEPHLQTTPQLLNPLREARDWTHNLMIPSQICFCCTMMGTPLEVLSNKTFFNSEVSSYTVFQQTLCCTQHMFWTPFSLSGTCFTNTISPQRISSLARVSPIFIYRWNGFLSFRSVSNVIASIMYFQVILKRIIC